MGIVRPSRSGANNYLSTIRNSTHYASTQRSTTSSTTPRETTTFYTPTQPMIIPTNNQEEMHANTDRFKVKYDDKGYVIQSAFK